MIDGCELIGLDLGRCLTGTLLGWVPDWLWWAIDHWQWIVGAIVALAIVAALYRVYRIFGIWGLIGVMNAAAFFAGFLLGRKPVVRVTPSPTGTPTVTFPGSRTPVVVRRPDKVHHDTIWDTLGKMPGR